MFRARPVRALAVQAEPRLSSRPPGARARALALCALLGATACARLAPVDEDAAPPQTTALTVGAPYAVGDELAVVELETPQHARFLLRATVPLPPGLFPRPDGRAPFSFEGPDGRRFHAQNEIVTRYPVDAQGADVVEVAAWVELPPAALSAPRTVFSVVWDPHPVRHSRVAPAVRALLDAPHAVALEARDVFGHRYATELLAPLADGGSGGQVLRDGAALTQTRLHDWMMPDKPQGGSRGTLPHFLGAHGFVTLYDGEEFLSLDLRVHNGGSGHDPDDVRDDPLGEVFFDALRLVLPAGWRVACAIGDPYFDGPEPLGGGRTATPLVQRLAGGQLHLMPAQAQFSRRLVIYRDDVEVAARARALLAEEGLAFARAAQDDAGRELFSWWNPDTGRYFPQNQRLPDLGFLDEQELRDDLHEELTAITQALEAGTPGPWPLISDAMGWCHPWGPSIGYLHGGTEIFLIDGLRTAAAASRDGYLLHRTLERMYTCRQSDTLYNADGRETRVEDWLQTSPNGVQYLPVWIFLKPVLFLGDSFGFQSAPTFQQEAVAALGREPDYAPALRTYEAIDIEHMVRYTRSLKTLAWLGNDALAKSELLMQAELMRLSYDRFPQAPNGQAIVTGMYKDAAFAHANPGHGLDVNRGTGWALDTMTAAYALAAPEWREQVLPWFRSLVDLFHLGQESCTGVVTTMPNWSWFGAQYRLRQSISAAILEHALWGSVTTVFAGRDEEGLARARQVLERSLYSSIADDYWDPVEHKPFFLAATGPFDLTQPGFCGPPPPGSTEGHDDYQVWSSFAYGYRLTGDPAFLQRAIELAGGDLSHALRKHAPGDLENRAALLQLVQQQGGL
ncbi:MAG: hypothetical protein H6828_00180 [Planctomycetes bacterium]|nr:hypothetical protein [Planctomycetota bacterium]